jgi:hypothetical protein
LGTGESVINVVIFLLLSTALFAPIFMQMFGGDFVEFMEPNDDRLRFDTFWQAFLALIMVSGGKTACSTMRWIYSFLVFCRSTPVKRGQ